MLSKLISLFQRLKVSIHSTNRQRHLLCEMAVLEHVSFNLALPLIRITRVQFSTSPTILQSKC